MQGNEIKYRGLKMEAKIQQCLCGLISVARVRFVPHQFFLTHLIVFEQIQRFLNE